MSATATTAKVPTVNDFVPDGSPAGAAAPWPGEWGPIRAGLEAAAGAGLRAFRRDAFAAMERLGPPRGKSEDFSYLRHSEYAPFLDAAATRAAGNAEVTAAEIAPHILPPCRDSVLVLVDGAYRPDLSRLPEGFPAPLPLAEVLDGPGGEAWRARLAPEREDDPLAALAKACAAAPLALDLAPGARPDRPLQILWYTSQVTGKLPNPARLDAYLALRLGRLAEATLALTFASAAAAGGRMLNAQVDIPLAEGASLRLLQSQAEAGDAIHFSKLAVKAARDSRCEAITLALGAAPARLALGADLEGEGAEFRSAGASVLAGSRQAHRHLKVRHLVPRCASAQHFKAVAADKSRASFDGTIWVAPGAQGTDAGQLANNLMLSDEARADTKPRLMIHADDVKCSHGATVGRLDANQQFYLVSRGLEPARARNLMTEAFVAEITSRIGNPGLRAGLEGPLLRELRAHLDQPGDGQDARARGPED